MSADRSFAATDIIQERAQSYGLEAGAQCWTPAQRNSDNPQGCALSLHDLC
jgi:hypothetical protein